ncbi:hypothetical protein AB6A40_005477 [Gnathostoma spinigerum]|uniref:Uncharacterized protein n=1 Tax=Gnathostoma spinigerum TaxID=75299 RepID=A0ABD6EFP8_9BILA
MKSASACPNGFAQYERTVRLIYFIRHLRKLFPDEKKKVVTLQHMFTLGGDLLLVTVSLYRISLPSYSDLFTAIPSLSPPPYQSFLITPAFTLIDICQSLYCLYHSLSSNSILTCPYCLSLYHPPFIMFLSLFLLSLLSFDLASFSSFS